jgi:hypothetical protein
VAPGLTVKSRLQVLIPTGHHNYYEYFNIVPPALREHLRQGRGMVRNWHALNWESDEKIRKKKVSISAARSPTRLTSATCSGRWPQAVTSS